MKLMGEASITKQTRDGEDLTHLAEAWDAFFIALRRARSRSREREDGLTLSQYELLRPLTGSGGMPSGKLAEIAGIAAASATQMLDRLEQAGVIERSHSPGDRRIVTITLTAEGRRKLRRKHRRIADQRRRFFDSFPPEERRQTERLLRSLTQVISDL
jgi:DNA-binding MarR family transcriptional regulator